MEFPQRDRVIYGRNPLVEVICQIRFPAILEIDSKIPADFQKGLRQDYPHVEISESVGLDLKSESRISDFPRQRTYAFVSDDKHWKVTLTHDFIALSCERYQRWEHFREKLMSAAQNLINVYQPSLFSRIGLRYKDVINRHDLGLESVPWRELVQPTVLGFAGQDDVDEQDVRTSQYVAQLAIPHGAATFRAGFVTHKESKVRAFSIDVDFFDEQTMPPSLDDAKRILDHYNKHARYCFQWCIQPRLHEALQPAPA